MEKIFDKWEVRYPAMQTWTELKIFFEKMCWKLNWHAAVNAKQEENESEKNIAEKRKKETKENRDKYKWIW